MYKVLFVTSEAYPLVKTGGLGDVAGSLPVALAALQCDVRLMLPAYQAAVQRSDDLKSITQFYLDGLPGLITILEGRLPGTNVKTWLVDYPPAFDRPGNPYLDKEGEPWLDNAERFALFDRVATAVSLGQANLDWTPDVVHCHDWQTGLVPALLAQEPVRPATLFTIHNLSYQGLFPVNKFQALGLPASLWSLAGVEFFGQFSFIKGGLAFADMLSTVSPTYAHEIQTTEFGCGLDGLLRFRANRLVGIINGIDTDEWNPATDSNLAKNFDVLHFSHKLENKKALQQEFALPIKPKTPLIGMVGRLVQQKGIDMVIKALPLLVKSPLQLVILGSGESKYETTLQEWSKKYPDRIAVKIGYNESLAHRIEAGADIFLMPSRFEPCGLNQLYSVRYGTVPIVSYIGGLADTIVDADEVNIAADTATGIVFHEDTQNSFLEAIQRALTLYHKPSVWKRIATTGMEKKFNWELSAQKYMQVYQQAINFSRGFVKLI